MDASQGTNIPYMGPPASSISVSDGKRKRRPTTFAGFLTSDRQLDNLITGKQAPSSSTPGMTGGGTGIELAAVAAVAAGTSNNNQNYQEFGITVGGPVAAGAARTIPSKQHRSAAAAGTARVRTQQNVTAPKAEHGETPPPGGRASVPSHPNVKKVVGVQNATRKALEWLQHGDLTLLDLAQSLPKLSKARVEIVMEALRAAGLVTLVRKHAPNAMGDDHVTGVYRFSAGRTPAQALEIGGGKAVTLGSISKRIRVAETELTALNDRINIIKKETAKAKPNPQQVMEILRQFMKQDKTLEDDPFYAVAYKATADAANDAAKAAAAAAAAAAAQAAAIAEADRAARAAQARKKAAENAAMAAAEAKKYAAAAAAADTTTAAAAAASAIMSQNMASAKTSTITPSRAAPSQPPVVAVAPVAAAAVAAQRQASVEVVGAQSQMSLGVPVGSVPPPPPAIAAPVVALPTPAPLVGGATAGVHAPPGN